MILNRVKNYIEPSSLEIHIYKDGVYILNYCEISSFSDNRIDILNDVKKVSILGNKLVISRLKKYEMFISGDIKEVIL